MIRKIARFSTKALAAFALIGLIALTVVGLFGEKVLRTQVESRLATALSRPVTVGSLSVNLAGRVVELRDVFIPGLPGSTRPSLVAPRIRLALSFRSLFTSKILLRGLELDRPRISLQVFPDGSTDFPQAGPSSSTSSHQVSIGQVVVTAGNLFLNDQQMPLELDWPNFEASLKADATNLLKGDLSAGPGPMRFGARPAQDARFEVGLRFADSVLTIDRGLFAAAGTNLSVVGTIDLHKEPEGSLQLSGPFDLESFDQKVAGLGLDLKGIAQTKAVLGIDGSKLLLTGTLRGQSGSFASLPIDSFATNLSWDGSNVRLKDLALGSLAGKAILDVDAMANAPVRVKGKLDGISAEPLLRWLFGYGTAGLGSRVSGPIDLSLPRGATNLLSGRGDLSLTADPALGEPLSGRFPFKAERGVITLTDAQLDVPSTSVTMGGTIQPDKRLNLDLKLVSEDLASTDALGVRLRGAFGTKSAQALGATGRGTLEGHVQGTMAAPVVTGRFVGSNVAYLGVAWGDLDWEGTVSADALKSDGLVAVRGASRWK